MQTLADLTSSSRAFSPDWIDGDTRIVAIVADPISQVKSPQFFNSFFARQGIHAVLVPAHVTPERLHQAVSGLAALQNLAGVVITVPHKVAAYALADVQPTERAAAIGAVNCLRKREEGGWLGDNFDGEGFVIGLEQQGVSVSGRQVLLVGAAGGAGRALANALCTAQVAALRLADIREKAAEALAVELRSRYGLVHIEIAEATGNRADDLVVNASPAGMSPSDSIPIDISHINRSAVVADLIMKPEQTPLLQKASAMGLRTHAGRHLLLSSVEQIAKFLGVVS
ncbi:Shikimate dehydrogenase (NADP(+)) [Paraburkholderia graminis C4D1M]|jgi:shikimate dehydrogenase|uniref:Shikimate dehydrogenase substrate binding domain protein n=1 Tax=Paraburkholderia graminis (strain ATCC 700544 / DSM 17151 / LMG 18924 / NCIMB 13744 / C4D1M) TaxID=396598 RepID=B1G4W9_PARG4|nr:shikimate dehydrogenase [Paraburkholderia graminis]EDT08739.1 Shikimate dehydrogenase substrate binding domain protein [Paraburkholderia graminis C4D1M]CAB3643150.1 Shikimate dehydrogenase (NADP(+)) [Paraburkholderia graminis C4D1M]